MVPQAHMPSQRCCTSWLVYRLGATAQVCRHRLWPAAKQPHVTVVCSFGLHPRNPCSYVDCCSFTYTRGMEGWVGLDGWPIADGFPQSDHLSTVELAQVMECLLAQDLLLSYASCVLWWRPQLFPACDDGEATERPREGARHRRSHALSLPRRQQLHQDGSRHRGLPTHWVRV